jgi:pyruvate/2-oxoglutarate dehydrogenase complex dihydrolipoamide dehydrogenase (E3) component
MSETIRADLCVIGGGSGGLTVAAGAAQMGAKVVLVEKGRMGGDCLNTGCVPSKSLIAAADAANVMRSAGRFGIKSVEPQVDFAAVSRHIHDVIATIAPHDSVDRFEGLGVRVILGEAQFEKPDTVIADRQVIKARRFVIATGSRAAVPPIPGLDRVPYLTNETVFDLDHLPRRLVIVGGGPIGCELGQAYRRLGAEVTIVELEAILPKEDPDLADVVRRRLIMEGIDIREMARAGRVERTGDGITVLVDLPRGSETLSASHLLIATGRAANVEDLGLDKARVAFSPAGIAVDRRLRTTNKRIFAIGDVTGGLQFTHMAGYHGGVVVRNAVFKLPSKASTRAVPRVTFTDPELAHVGLTEHEARDSGHTVTVLKSSFESNDRARTERDSEGFIKVLVGRKGRILGASIIGHHAGELILPWVLAINEGLAIRAMASLIAPYPTLSEISKAAAGSYYTPSLFSEKTRRIVRLLQKLG